MLKVLSDVVVQLESPGHWVITNVFARTCLGADSTVLELLGDLGKITDSELEGKYASGSFRIWEIGRFTNYDGLMADPTRRLRNVADWPDAEELDFSSLLTRLRERFILVDDEASYRAKFAPKTSLVDSEHFGNFHQQLGQELLMVHRESPDDWWVRQKFSDDLLQVRDNLYGAIQAHYLEAYFSRRFPPGSSVVDVGCGIGFYSNMMARSGASVLGIDPSEKYISIARKNAVENTRFEVLDVGKEGALDTIPSASADFVFMSDALLFYFVPPGPKQEADIQILLSDIHRILKPEGLFISMEPHYIFWLLPWLGEAKCPFTILTEYMNKTFHVTPTISKLIQAYAQGRFGVFWMDEILPKEDFSTKDPRAYHFAREFPLWQIFELKKLANIVG